MTTTQVSSLHLNQTAFEKMAYFALRPELYYDQFAEVEATNATNPGDTHTFTIFQDLAVASSEISETVDVTPVALSDSQVSVTMKEYGNAVVTSAKLRATSFIPVDPVAANAVGFNAGVSIDTVCRNVLQADDVRLADLGYVSARGSWFVKDTLEKTIQMISEEIGVPMEILGPDLQLEGITKNQSFGLDETDKTAEAVLRVRVDKPAGDTLIARVVRLVEEAADAKGPSERFIERFARWYMPLICLIALAVALIPPLVWQAPWDVWIYRALTLLLPPQPASRALAPAMVEDRGTRGAPDMILRRLRREVSAFMLQAPGR